MRVVVLTDPAPDYGADYLYDGFCRYAGLSNVYDYPIKPSLHAEVQHGFDCDMEWPHSYRDPEFVHGLLRDGQIDLIVVSAPRRGQYEALVYLEEVGLLAKYADRIAYCDMEDTSGNLFLAHWGLQPSRALFKRELHDGQPGTSLPFGYPEDRVVKPAPDRVNVAAMFHVWQWCSPGDPRTIRHDLATAITGGYRGNKRIDAHITSDGEGLARLPRHEYHKRLRHCAAALVPAGAGWFTNRLFEVAAAGCAPIVETAPATLRFDNRFDRLRFATVVGAMSYVDTFLNEPELARQAGADAQRCLLNHHTTRHRAHTICDVMGVGHGKPADVGHLGQTAGKTVL